MKDPSIVIIDASLRTKKNDMGDHMYRPSGIVVLLLCKLERGGKKTGWSWGEEHYNVIKKSKPNIIGASMGHFGSEGNYYSYGNKGNFGIVDGSSVGQYVVKSFKKESSKLTAKEGAKVIEEMAARDLGIGIDSLVKLIPKLKSLIAPVINTGFNLQGEKGNVNLKCVPASESGL